MVNCGGGTCREEELMGRGVKLDEFGISWMGHCLDQQKRDRATSKFARQDNGWGVSLPG